MNTEIQNYDTENVRFYENMSTEKETKTEKSKNCMKTR